MGIVDWFLTALLPFGIESDLLFPTVVCMDHGGWHDYMCCQQCRESVFNVEIVCGKVFEIWLNGMPEWVLVMNSSYMSIDRIRKA